MWLSLEATVGSFTKFSQQNTFETDSSRTEFVFWALLKMASPMGILATGSSCLLWEDSTRPPTKTTSRPRPKAFSPSPGATTGPCRPPGSWPRTRVATPCPWRVDPSPGLATERQVGIETQKLFPFMYVLYEHYGKYWLLAQICYYWRARGFNSVQSVRWIPGSSN